MSSLSRGGVNMVVLQNFINGKFVDANDFIDSFEPSTGEVYAKVPASGPKDVELAIQAAENAKDGWAKCSRAKRSFIMMKIADLLEARLEEFAKAESRDQGKPVWLAKTVDIPRAVHNFRFFSSAVLHFGNESSTQSHLGALNYTVRSPVGVVGQITPWNLPLYLLTFKIAPAIAAGNCIVCKPSEFTSVTAWMLCGIFNDAGLPPGVVNMVFGNGKDTGAELVLNPAVRAISFTGSTLVGHYIQEKAAPLCKKLSLELGGKNAAIVFDDANIEKAVSTCIRQVISEAPALISYGNDFFLLRKIKVGPPEDDSSFMGALVSKQHYEKVKYFISLAEEEGGKILCGEGKDEPLDLPEKNKNGYFVRPTVVVGLADNTKCMQEEVFGPFVCIAPFDTEEEAVRRANGVNYGLCATVWSENGSRIHRVAPKLEAGTIWCNCWLIRDLNMPFGGYKQSGLGREGYKDSLEFYTEVKTICVKIDEGS
eukprot:gene8611-14623_t